MDPNSQPQSQLQTVPMFAPNGQTGDIPTRNVEAAIKAGFKPAYSMTAPGGQTGYIPQDRYQDAVKAGFKLNTEPGVHVAGTNAAGRPMLAPDDVKSHPTAWGFTPGNVVRNVGTGLEQLGQGVVQGLSDVGGVVLPQSLGGDPWNNLQLVNHIVQPMEAEAGQARQLAQQGQMGQAAGHGIAAAVPVIGPWAANLAEQAGTGDVGGAVARGGTQILAPKAVAAAAPLLPRALGRAALMGKTPEGAYEEALKPSTTYTPAERTQMVQTGLREGIPVSKAGAAKLSDIQEQIDAARDAEIAKNPTQPISPGEAAPAWKEARARAANQVNPNSDLEAFDNSWREYLNRFRPNGQPTGAVRNMTAEEAQSLKTGTYRALGDKSYGELQSASVESQKAIVRGVKNAIAAKFPALQDLNARDAQLYDLDGPLERAVARQGNRGIIQMGTALVAGGVRALGGSDRFAAGAAVIRQALDDPMVKSRLAIAVSKAQRVPIAAARAQVESYATSLGRYAAAQGSVSSGDNSANPASTAP